MQELIKSCKELIGTNLIAVIEFGSEGKNANVLVVLDMIDFGIIDKLRKPIKSFIQRANVIPLLTTKKELARSTDVFPLELIDIKYPHHVLYGTDVLAKISFKKNEVRQELEFELRSKMIHLRAQYLNAKSNKDLHDLMKASVPTLMPLFYGLLFLKKNEIPQTLKELYTIVEKVYNVDMNIFHAIRKDEITDANLKNSIKELMTVLEKLINIIDTMKVKK